MNKILTLTLGLTAALNASATTHVIDDFLGGPHTVMLSSLAPPELVTGSFPHAGAIGGIRDAAVWSVSQGLFAAGVAFNAGGYASFAGRGEGGVVWDGVAGLTDSNNDKAISADELDYGLNFDLSDCTSGTLEITAFADLPNAVLRVAFATDAGNYNLYDIALAVGTADYSVDLTAPSSSVGALNFADIGAVAIFVDASAFDNLDVLVSKLEVSCPDGGWTLGLMGLGLVSLPALRRFIR